MEKKHYFNFPAFRKALYDAELTERARVIYMHLLQKSSAKGSNEVELTKPQIANDLGILTKNRDALAPKNVQRALGELEAHGYLTKWQRYKGEGVPLTIKLNMNEEFLKQKRIEDAPNADKNEGTESQEPSENVHPYNHSLSSSNPFISSTNPSLSSSNHSEPDSSEEVEDEDKKLEKEFSEEIPENNMDDWEVVCEQYQVRIEKASSVEEVQSATHEFCESGKAIEQRTGLPDEFFSRLDVLKEFRDRKVESLKAKSIPG